MDSVIIPCTIVGLHDTGCQLLYYVNNPSQCTVFIYHHYLISSSTLQDLGNTLQSVLCNIVTADALELDHLNAIDIAFGTTGYKLQLAARAIRVRYLCTMYTCTYIPMYTCTYTYLMYICTYIHIYIRYVHTSPIITPVGWFYQTECIIVERS